MRKSKLRVSKRWSIGLALALVALVGWGCSSGPTLPEAGVMPDGEDFSGMWYSEQFEQ